jgi:hypothetical protein
LLNRIETIVNQELLDDKQLTPFYRIFWRYVSIWSSHDWFTEQVENPTLTQDRGGNVAQPLPTALGCFDHQGMPLKMQQRANLVKLKHWADDDDNWLQFVFPKGLSAAEDKLFRADLAQLKQQPWSPYAFMDAVLDDWPVAQAEQDWSLASAKQAMIKEGEALIALHQTLKKAT